MLVSLSGQVVVIVGASSGTGRAAAVLFAREGAKVVAGARREDRLQSLKDELAREQLDIIVRRADASKVEDMQQLAQAALEGSISFSSPAGQILATARRTGSPRRYGTRSSIQISTEPSTPRMQFCPPCVRRVQAI
jgi:NAD(P)-dependent dehydrogenase (short-subunit alcohol dehydrogenase family)